MSPFVAAQAPYVDDTAAHQTPAYVSHRASLRFVPTVLLGGDLGPGQSPIATAVPGEDGTGGDDPMSWASLRLRYDSVLHIGPRFGIHLGLDALDNLVLGSGPDPGLSWGDGLWLDGQTPPTARDGDLGDSLRVRQLYGSWRIMNWADLAVGRMTDHFGLGLQRNLGMCLDCDRTSLIDGLRITGTFMNVAVEMGWETSVSGATDEDPDEAFGQPVDLSDQDDVSTFTLRMGRGASRRHELLHGMVAVPVGGFQLDWRFFTSSTDQIVSSSEPVDAALGSVCETERETAGGVTSQPDSCWQLVRRGAELWRPGLWARARWRPDPQTTIRLEAEAAGLFGQIDTIQRLDGIETDAKTLSGLGAAIETEISRPGWSFGVDAGFASGDNGRYLGILDGQNLAETGDDLDVDQRILDDGEITSFWFNRDYHLDLILFQRILGGVTNAVYAKPWIAGTLLDTESARFGARLDVLYAAAARPSGTPGRGDHYGVEIDGRVTLDLPDGLSMELAGGLLLPMDALQGRVSGAAAEPATLVRGLLTWRFE
jgi:uncharacterized protein (TIGR04551 family)